MEYLEVKQQVVEEFEFWHMNLVARVQGPADAVEKALREVLDQLEHSFLNDIFPFTEINPSSENLAK